LGKEVADIAKRINRTYKRWAGIAFLDDAANGPSFYGLDVLRFESIGERFGIDGVEAIIANGEPFVRKEIQERLVAAGIRLASVIDDSAVISPSSKIGPGAVIFPGCFVSSMAILGRNVAIIAGSTIGHDSVFGENCVISGQVNIGGHCSVGSESYIGMGAQIREGIHIGRGAVVGMGSVVFADIPDEVIALGNPCRPARPNINQRVFS
jgi:sugar O-acyltransferase (sialic acid O-acetyltransferase NeuD family)